MSVGSKASLFALPSQEQRTKSLPLYLATRNNQSCQIPPQQSGSKPKRGRGTPRTLAIRCAAGICVRELQPYQRDAAPSLPIRETYLRPDLPNMRVQVFVVIDNKGKISMFMNMCVNASQMVWYDTNEVLPPMQCCRFRWWLIPD
ncbi:hypothetical protein VTL71DRAFT_12772 [Oculimacula yallundae]|uniref:Uncharacterized protein n=1 Tax=Oculimacula yallundae TaxID=86028 RepID=A0ABR4CPS0_9HELO